MRRSSWPFFDACPACTGNGEDFMGVQIPLQACGQTFVEENVAFEPGS